MKSHLTKQKKRIKCFKKILIIYEDISCAETELNYIINIMSEQLKEGIKLFIKEKGVKEVAEDFSRAIQESEFELKIDSDRDLLNAFAIIFPLFVESYNKFGIKKKRLIKQILLFESVKKSLEMIEWDSPKQSIAMKEAKSRVDKILSN